MAHSDECCCSGANFARLNTLSVISDEGPTLKIRSKYISIPQRESSFGDACILKAV